MNFMKNESKSRNTSPVSGRKFDNLQQRSFEAATITSSIAIKVVLIPLGYFPQDKYRLYVEAIKRNQSIELQSLTHFMADSQQPMPNRNWSDGRLWFDFIESENLTNEEWELFRAHQRPMAVICLVHCPSFSDLNAVYIQFQQIRKKYRRALRFRCFAFEPLDTMTDSLERSDVIMFPNTGSDDSHLGFYISTFIQDLATFLLQDFETILVHADDIMYFNTPYEPDKSELEPNRAKKLRVGRVAKFQGDYCLLAASPVDAIYYYNSAIKSCEDQDDYLWHAGALEGLASATLLKQLETEAFPFFSAPSNDIKSSVENQVQESLAQSILSNPFYQISYMLPSVSYLPQVTAWLEQAFNLYSRYQTSTRQTTRLRVECLYMQACYCGVHFERKGAKLEVLEILRKANLIGLTGVLNIEARISLALESATICHRVKSFRKFSSYLFIVMNLCNEISRYHVNSGKPVSEISVFCLKSISKVFGADFDEFRIDKINPSYFFKTCSDPGWPFFQKFILSRSIENAKLASDYKTVINCSLFALEWLVSQPFLDRNYIESNWQADLVQNIVETFRKCDFCSDLRLSSLSILPILLSIQPVQVVGNEIVLLNIPKLFSSIIYLIKLKEKRVSAQLEDAIVDEDDGFLYEPTSKAINSVTKPEIEEIYFSCSEIITFRVKVFNPLSVPLQISSITPVFDFIPCDGAPSCNDVFFFPTSCVIEGLTESEIYLSGKCTRVGTLSILGCRIEIFGAPSFIFWSHLLNQRIRSDVLKRVHHGRIDVSSKISFDLNSVQIIRPQPNMAFTFETDNYRSPVAISSLPDRLQLYSCVGEESIIYIVLRNTGNYNIYGFTLEIREISESSESFTSKFFCGLIKSECETYFVFLPCTHSATPTYDISLCEFATAMDIPLPDGLSKDQSIFTITDTVLLSLSENSTSVFPMKSNQIIKFPLSVKSNASRSQAKFSIEYCNFDPTICADIPVFSRKIQKSITIVPEPYISLLKAEFKRCSTLPNETISSPFLFPPDNINNFMFIIRLGNNSDFNFNLSCSKDIYNSSYIIEKIGESCFAFTINRLNSEMSSKLLALLSADEDRMASCCDFIAELFPIKWASANGRYGTLKLTEFLKSLDYTGLVTLVNTVVSETLSVSFRCPISKIDSLALGLSSYGLNNFVTKYHFYRSRSSGYCCTAQKIFDFHLNVQNLEDHAKSLQLRIHPYQFSNSSQFPLNFEIKNKIILHGSYQPFLPSILSKQTVALNYKIIFLEPGEYCFFFTTSQETLENIHPSFITKYSIRFISE